MTDQKFRDIRGGRPACEIRSTLVETFRQLALERGGATWRDAANAACIGFRAAKVTTENLVRAGQLVPVADVRVPGARQPMKLYRPNAVGSPAAIASEAAAAGAWAT